MKKTNKRIIAAILTFMMIFAASSIAFAAEATQSSGSGNQEIGGGSFPPQWGGNIHPIGTTFTQRP